MGQWKKASCHLTQKMQILEKIAANTETQCRFIHKREMKGLGRVLKERGVLLEELTALNQELISDQTWKNVLALAPMAREIARRQQELLKRSRQVLQEAVAERELIAAELRNSKVHRQVKNQYVHPWAIMARGIRINQKG